MKKSEAFAPRTLSLGSYPEIRGHFCKSSAGYKLAQSNLNIFLFLYSYIKDSCDHSDCNFDARTGCVYLCCVSVSIYSSYVT